MHAVRVLEVLQQDEDFFRRLGLAAGLRSMTAKQFIVIINYCHQVICGYPLETASKGDPTNEIIEFLKNVECPYIINKSLFKSPAAPHTFDQSVTLLNWLADFIPPSFPDGMIKSYDAQCDFIEKDEKLPDAAFTKEFHEKATIGFEHWNERREDEHVQHVDMLIDSYLEHYYGGKITSQAAQQQRTEMLNNDLVELKKFDRNIPNERTFEVAESQALQLEADICVLKEKLKKDTDQHNALEFEFKAKKYKQDGFQTQVDNIMEGIRKQRYNFEQMTELRREYQHIQHSVGLEQKLINEIKDAQNESTIQLARQARVNSDAEIKLKDDLDAFVRVIAETKFGRNKHITVLKKLVVQNPLPLPKIKDVLNELDPTAAICDLKVERKMQAMRLNEAKIKMEASRLQCRKKETELNEQAKSLEALKTTLEEERLSGDFKIEQLDKLVQGLRARVIAAGEINANKTEFLNKLDEYNEANMQNIQDFFKYRKAMLDAHLVKGDKVCEILSGAKPRCQPDAYRHLATMVINKFLEDGDEMMNEINAKVNTTLAECNQRKNELLKMPGAGDAELQDFVLGQNDGGYIEGFEVVRNAIKALAD